MTTIALVRCVLAGSLTLGVAAASRGEDGSSVEAQLEALRDEVGRLRAQLGDDWLTEERAEEIRGLVDDVLADADTRASLLQSGLTAGYDGKFFLASADGNFRLDLTGVLQVRFVFNRQDDGPDDDYRWGFENKRTAIRFGGHVVDPSWRYFVQGNFGADGGTFKLLDAFVTKDLGGGWTVRAGKYRVPFLREQLVNYTNLLTVERSLVTSALGAGRAEGVEVAWKGDQFKVAGAFTDGIDGIGGVSAPALAYDTEYTLVARAEFLAMGGWAQFNDFSGWRGSETGLLVGAGLVWTSGEFGTDADETENFRWTVDGSLLLDGANVYAAFTGSHSSENGSDLNADQYGLIVQGGFFVSDDIELFGRYEWGDDDTDADDLSVLTLGVNKFFSRQRVRWVSDVGYAFNQVSPFFANSGAGWRADTTDQDGQFVLRSQLQLMF